MMDKLGRLGQRSLIILEAMSYSGAFLIRVLLRRPNFKKLATPLVRQFYFVGVLSCLIITIAALFVGMVIGLQGYHTLQKFGASSQLGQLLALSITRELGPVISALLFVGRAGSAITAEIGLMKATAQLASIEMMGVDPLGYIIYPRFLAALVTLPLLTLIFITVAIYGGYFIGVEWLGLDSGTFWANMQSEVNFRLDILSGIIKSFVFSFFVVWIAVYQGFNCLATAEGISQATTRTVVYASLCVLGLDFILTAVMIGGW